MEHVLGAVLPGKLGEKHRKRLDQGSLVYDHMLKKWTWQDGVGPKGKAI
jgi:hypothetical protein